MGKENIITFASQQQNVKQHFSIENRLFGFFLLKEIKLLLNVVA
jgi:hypothetical protein